MKRSNGLWDELVSFENLFLAYRKARRGKRSRPAVERFEFHREIELARLQQELMNDAYQPGGYQTFLLHDTKPRMISAAPFRDRIVHHALCNVLEPIFERSFIFDSYASRKEKGTHRAIHRYQHFARKNAYVLKCDVRQFFPSIDHQILKERLARKIKEDRVLHLADLIIDNSNPQAEVPGYFPGDDLLTSMERRRGLPIGNQTSQCFGNVYLDALDHFIKETLRCRFYLRYVDDFVVLENDREKLADIRDQIEGFLLGMRLWLHPRKRVISSTGKGIRLLGFRVWPGRIWIPHETLRRVRRRFRHFQAKFQQREMDLVTIRQRLCGWLGHARTLSSDGYRSRILRDIVFRRTATEESFCSRRLLVQQRRVLAYFQAELERTREPE